VRRRNARHTGTDRGKESDIIHKCLLQPSDSGDMNEKSGNTIRELTAGLSRSIGLATIMVLFMTSASISNAQVSPEEHAEHHPGQAGDSNDGPGTSGMGGPPEGAGPPNGMMGGKGGGMGGMMKKMGAPKPKAMYPKLMDLPGLPMEERAKIEAEAHQRMIDGAELMGSGFDQLTAAAPGRDFASMQKATASIREGLSQFESGLAAQRAIAEGKSPRNVALQWFRKEMNLLPTAAAPSGFRFFGMSTFHTAAMMLLIAFTAAMIWMYFFKMRRASALLETLSNANSMADSRSIAVGQSASMASVTTPIPSKPVDTNRPVAVETSVAAQGADCCAIGEDACPSESLPTDGAKISSGLLPVAERKLCRLKVARIIQETADVKTFRLVACHGGSLPFSYLPGQFLTFTLPVADKPIRRSYTISSSPTQGFFCDVTVKREDKGAGSRYLHDNVAVGDMLEAKAASGKFIFTGKEADSIVLIAGGVGITPMMSITRALIDMCWLGDIWFLVACRDLEHLIYESELKQLEQQHDNLHVHVAMSRIEKAVGNYRPGRLNKEMLTEWVPDISSRRIHICGAPAMMETTKGLLAELGVPSENIHSENFGSTKKPKTNPKTKTKAVTREGPASSMDAPTVATLTFATSNKSTALLPDETILEAAERIGVDIDYSCRVGTCGECAVKLTAGNVAMEEEDGLEPNDKAAGLILACQGKSTGDVTVEA